MRRENDYKRMSRGLLYLVSCTLAKGKQDFRKHGRAVCFTTRGAMNIQRGKEEYN